MKFPWKRGERREKPAPKQYLDKEAFTQVRQREVARGRTLQRKIAEQQLAPRAIRRALLQVEKNGRRGRKARSRLMRAGARRGYQIKLIDRKETKE